MRDNKKYMRIKSVEHICEFVLYYVCTRYMLAVCQFRDILVTQLLMHTHPYASAICNKCCRIASVSFLPHIFITQFSMLSRTCTNCYYCHSSQQSLALFHKVAQHEHCECSFCFFRIIVLRLLCFKSYYDNRCHMKIVNTVTISIREQSYWQAWKLILTCIEKNLNF